MAYVSGECMVSFHCEACNDVLKKPKLDQHAGRCRGAYYTCVDCNNTFDGPTGNNGYRSHTSCVSEEQRYHKSVYKEPKKKGAKQQQQQQNNNKSQEPETAQQAPSVPADSDDSKKRTREEEEVAEKKNDAPAVTHGGSEKAEEKETGEGEPSKKKKKKSKKTKGEKEGESGEASAESASKKEEQTLSSFLSSTVPTILAESVSIVSLRDKVVEQAKEKGFTDVKQVEKALFEGMAVGGKKSKVKFEFA
ncbi:uncharacterized protein JCM6883_003399 [Sporobolomyces salmoneus]|uniref:uncharacterized protein n=1 Tax=Sporobolomyces salmoneus TaxID=183962 RepID=UPI00317CE41F